MKTVMIVEEHSFSRAVVRNIFEEMGWKVLAEVASGEEAIHMYSVYRPDLVMMDIHLRGMDGITATRKIVGIDPEANIIMCTVVGQKDVVVRAITAGAKHYMVKPLQKEKVEYLIDHLLASRAAHSHGDQMLSLQSH
ncbi:response regulator [Brevibacillus migulae]|uniref:response regulator n=1 Tax=Brevibacillus migulae TaxID=1644114 RepID=UPI00106F0475|nr:response regulator [Brevibacillus migulae]